jgi:hypothetical protein
VRRHQSEKPIEDFVRRMLFRACDLRLRGEGATPKVTGRPLTHVDMERLVAYARRSGFVPSSER